MTDENKTQAQLQEEIQALRTRMVVLEHSEMDHKRAGPGPPKDLAVKQ